MYLTQDPTSRPYNRVVHKFDDLVTDHLARPEMWLRRPLTEMPGRNRKSAQGRVHAVMTDRGFKIETRTDETYIYVRIVAQEVR